MRQRNFKSMKTGLYVLVAFSGSLMLQACNTGPRTAAEVELTSELFHSGLNRGIKTHVEEERKARERNRANANFLRDVFGDPGKKKKKPVVAQTSCFVIPNLELEPVHGVYGHAGGGGASGGGGTGGDNC